MPEMLSVFPPRWMLALPWIAVVEAIGLDAGLALIDRVAASQPKWLRVGWMAGCIALVLGVLIYESVRQPSTLAAAFSPLAGGPSAVVRDRTLSAVDASSAAPRGTPTPLLDVVDRDGAVLIALYRVATQ